MITTYIAVHVLMDPKSYPPSRTISSHSQCGPQVLCSRFAHTGSGSEYGLVLDAASQRSWPQ
jgi:hypothetical protein